MTVIVGIDPGVRPTLCRYEPGNLIEFSEDTALVVKRSKGKRTVPQPALIAGVLRSWRPDLIVIEQVNAVGKIAGQKRSPLTGGLLMHARGMCEGVAAALGIPYELVPPNVWTRALKVNGGPEGARKRALEIDPALADHLGHKKDHNRAAAFLMAVWGASHGTSPLL